MNGFDCWITEAGQACGWNGNRPGAKAPRPEGGRGDTAAARRVGRRLAHWFALLLATGTVAATAAATTETLVMRDGSVLKATVDEAQGDRMAVHTAYGDLTVGASDVLLRTNPTEPAPVISETYVVETPDGGGVATYLRRVPEGGGEPTTVTLLIAGKVLAVHDRLGCPVAWQAEDAGAFAQLILRSGDLPKGADAVEVTARVDGIVAATPDGKLEFTQNYTPDRDGRMRVVVKYPADWKLESASPEPATRVDGLVAWDRHLSPQMSCAPRAVFLSPGGAPSPPK